MIIVSWCTEFYRKRGESRKIEASTLAYVFVESGYYINS